jgi:integrase
MVSAAVRFWSPRHEKRGRWSDLDTGAQRLSISRTLQTVGGRPTEFGAKTRTSRRCVDLDTHTTAVVAAWRERLRDDGLPHRVDDWMFCNATGRHLNPQSVSQLFPRMVRRSGLPVIRCHDLRHTHASVLAAYGVPIKVVTERLGHAHPAGSPDWYRPPAGRRLPDASLANTEVNGFAA